jgi:hypothetical protein
VSQPVPEDDNSATAKTAKKLVNSPFSSTASLARLLHLRLACHTKVTDRVKINLLFMVIREGE